MNMFFQIISSVPPLFEYTNVLKASQLKTALGDVIAIADEKALYLLEFLDNPRTKRDIERLQQKTKATIGSGYTEPIHSIESELNAYFNGSLKQFKTPVALLGTPFQQSVWQELQSIPFGKTRSYAQVAQALGKPTAYRAVAQANSTNWLPIIIPCHRVINSDNKLGGYNGGVERKVWLIDHEKRMSV